jgi:ribonucleoside-diphosphate reductase alpha subunit
MFSSLPSDNNLYVQKRDGRFQKVQFDKILHRLEALSVGLNVNVMEVARKTIDDLVNGIATSKLDEIAALHAANMNLAHPDYLDLASGIVISNHHKNTLPSFSATMWAMYHNLDGAGKSYPLISKAVYDIVQEHGDRLDAAIDDQRDYLISFFGFRTLYRAYLLRTMTKESRVYERPQHMWMRTAIEIHRENIEAAIETYNLLSQKYYTHATPTLFNAGTPRPQLSSCFLMGMDDSLESIYKVLTDCANISKWAGGIGIHVHNIRATGSTIRGTNGSSNGLLPMLRVYNATADYVDQGGGKRKGSFAIYLEPWHADIEIFLKMKRNQGKEKQRARDLFYAMWIPDLFMERVRDDAIWSLFCPDQCPGLADCWGAEFVELYQRYEADQRYVRQVPAREIWKQICISQEETGTPYMLYKDQCNRLSNQQNLGTIRSSNLCTEIIEYSDTNENAVCNLASIALPMFLKHHHDDNKKQTFNFKKLYAVTRVVTRNLNKLIDRNYYPTPETRRSNLRHRPIGIGVQGLADVFQALRYPFDSKEAYDLNCTIFETMYFAALSESCDLAAKMGPYESFHGSPLSEGKFHFDLWNEQCKRNPQQKPAQLSGLWDWNELRTKIQRSGTRNSLLLAPMPTASTSQILGNNETIEPYNFNLYTRRVLAGDYWVINHHMIRDLLSRGLWTPSLVEDLKVSNGSIQDMTQIPEELRNLYQTAYDLSQKTIIDMAAGRAPFIDQSQSLNLFLKEPSLAKLTSMHFYGWSQGLKTGMYYLRSQAASQNKATVAPHKLAAQQQQQQQQPSQNDENPENASDAFCTMEEGCLACGS